MAVTNINEIPIQPSPLGENFFTARDVNGPASYVAGTGQSVASAFFGLPSGIRFASSMGVTSDGANLVEITTPAGSANKTIVLRWYVATTGAEVGNGVNLSAKKIRILAIGN